MLGLICCRI